MRIWNLLAWIGCFLSGVGTTRAEVAVDGDTARFDGRAIRRTEGCRVEGTVKSTDPRALRYSEGKVILRAMRINGRATQDDIEIHLLPPTGRGKLPRLKDGDWFHIAGRWRDAKVTGVRGKFTFQVISLKATKPNPLRFADFPDRSAVFTGMAIEGGHLRCGAESASVEGVEDWPAGVAGREVEVRGVLKKSGEAWEFTAPSWRLLRLEDQVGQDVVLEGMLWSLNGVWWFDYRDERVCLISEKGPVLSFDTDRHATAARVTGRLLKQLRPALDQISLKKARDLVPQFVVRTSRVDFPEEPLSTDERFRAIYARPIEMKDGVPVLRPEAGFRLNLREDETKATLYRERNAPAIDGALRAPTTAQVEVMAKRLDSTKDPSLRLLYAAMLAACNDVRGRKALLEGIKHPKSAIFPDALYCIGAFPFLPPNDSVLKPETAWAEETLIRLLTERTKPTVAPDLLWRESDEKRITVAEACVKYSSVLECLLHGRSERARAAVIDFALSRTPGSEKAVEVLCDDEAPLPLDVLTRLAGTPTEEEPNRVVLEKMLRQKEVAAVRLFRDVLSADFVYSDFRRAMTPEIAKALAAELDNLTGESLPLAKLLIASQANDPVGEYIRLLDDPKWPDRFTIVWELGERKDPRIPEALLRALRRARDGFFASDSEIKTGCAITNCIEGIANNGGDPAISELIGLLSAQFGRAKAEYLDDAALHRIVAAHLINLTGESFGVDAAAWKKWFDSREPAR